jgi:S1-C subfamily serine protease
MLDFGAILKNKAVTTLIISLVLLTVSSCISSYQNQPLVTDKTVLAGKAAELAIPSVLRVVNIINNTAGTGFAHKSGVIITAEHVISSSKDEDIILILYSGQKVKIKSSVKDQNRDLAILYPESEVKVPTLSISEKSSLSIGDNVAAWGFPSGYHGLKPLLTVGYLSGEDHPGLINSPSQWVINAAFNRGNSGGPVVRLEDSTVIGVVSSKLAPLPTSTETALKALSGTKYGLQYTKREAGREPEQVSEAQVVAEVLEYLRSQTQLVLGFAVKLGELRNFLQENSIDP